MMKYRTIPFLLLYVCLCNSVFAADTKLWNEVELLRQRGPVSGKTKEAKRFEKNFSKLSDKSLSDGFRANRLASVKALMIIVRNGSLPDSSRFEAARMLGQIRAAEAVDVLLKQLTLAPYIALESTPGATYPCYWALVQIGKPASRKALLHLRTETNPLRRMLLREIVRNVEGKPVAIFLIKSELSRKLDRASKANLQAVLKKLTTKSLSGKCVSVSHWNYRNYETSHISAIGVNSRFSAETAIR